ncbi:hypothetical protein ACH4FX_42570 [Streptomyces sp. NPDC018019]|uniref:hypothetical protein n=1 Tax=Streptomyces sp. NPDC018019 TaxID=3365030 RepID=UPI00379180A9
MGNPNDRDRGRPREGQRQGAFFNQQGQQVNGPQYNADQIVFGQSITPDVIAEALRLYHKRPRKKGESSSSYNPQRHQKEQEELDLKLYGNRHYTRDRRRWLLSLPPRQRWNEERRASARTRHGKMPWHHHRRILRAGKLPPETSPADPRYLEVKREVERREDTRERYYLMASLLGMLALLVIAVLDNALWMAAILGSLLVIGLVSGYLKRRASL